MFLVLEIRTSPRKAEKSQGLARYRKVPGQTVEIIAIVQKFQTYDFIKSSDVKIQDILKDTGIKFADSLDLKSDLENPDIDIIIGADYYWAIVSGKTERLGQRTVALETKLRWCQSGAEKKSTPL